ncbi:MAG: hypothetical protein B6D55_02065 [Candidatus Omnitrophica bacterium 4484_70.2]|nr:MAG: hypothetical protein B6D55_02065 [Candidatus Omnitrophica bacterium 4484_70.2]
MRGVRGVTVLELLFVVVVIAILVAIVGPRFFKAAERARATEGVRILGTIRRVEIRYYSEHGYLTTNLDDLDIDVKGGIFFNLPVLKNVTYTGGDEVVASITRNSKANTGYGAYVLSIRGNGEIFCNATPPNKCPVGF